MDNNILKNLMESLNVGKEYALHLDELATLLHESPERTKVFVRQARIQGILIVSGQDGYWLSNDREEIMRFIRTMEKEIGTHSKITSAMRRSLEVLDGQLELTDQECIE